MEKYALYFDPVSRMFEVTQKRILTMMGFKGKIYKTGDEIDLLVIRGEKNKELYQKLSPKAPA